MRLKPEEIIDLSEQFPTYFDVENAMTKFRYGTNPGQVAIVREFLFRVRDQPIQSVPDLLIALDELRVHERSSRMYDDIIQVATRTDFNNFDPNLKSKPRKNFVHGQTCRNAMEFIQTLIAVQTMRQISISLPNDIYDDLTKASQTDGQLKTCKEAIQRFIAEAIREKLERRTEFE